MTTPALILFVEDNEATRYAVNRVLSGAGFRIVTAETGGKGISLARELKPDLLLLDVKLPDMTGFDVVAVLKGAPDTASIPVVHLSATHVTSDDQIRGLHGGADAYLTHPVEPRVLVATLTALLRVRLAEARYRRLFETRLLGILHASADGVIVDANDAFLALVGHTRADLAAGRVRWDRLDPGWAARRAASAALPRAAEATEAELIRSDGTRVPVIVGEALLEDERGEGVSFVLDISQRKRAEEALREADERKNEFLGVLSHELRNPLAPIRNAITILDRVRHDADQATRARGVIARQVDHLTRLVDDLLDVTRVARGKVQLRRLPVDLAEITRRTIEDHAPLLAREGIHLDARVPEQPVWVHGDGTRLAQILGNLIGNATKFSDPGGRVTVALEEAGGNAVVRVRDEGVGIPPELLGRLFEPFAQGDDTTSRARSRGGLGLGLALVKALVDLHGGSVAVHSEGLGAGAEFTVSLPLGTPERRAAARAGVAPAPRRVLVVEDNIDAAETLRDLLELDGHEVALAHTGKDGISLARAFRPDLVLCDIGLPDVDGYEVARALRGDAALRHVGLVALTGYALPDDLRRAEEAGFRQHIRKPPRLEELQEALATAPSGGLRSP